MGDWIKENKFEAGLLVVVLLIAIGAFLFGNKKGGLYKIHKEAYDSAASKLKQYQSKKPGPTASNAKNFEGQVNDYRAVIEGLQDKMVAYRPAEFAQIPPPQFIENLNTARTSVVQALEASRIEYPDDKFHLGFEGYTESLPPDDATAYLDYQLKALSSLFETLVAAKPSALVNVYRSPLPVENGQPMEGGSAESKTSGRPRSGRSTKAAATDAPPYYRLPLELTFTSSEPSARKFLADLASHKDYFFVIRNARIQNEKRDKAPKKDDVEFDDAPADFGNDAFDTSFDNELIPEGDPAPEGEPAPGDPADPADPAPAEDFPPAEEAPGGERILGQVLGGEQIHVFLELELLLFKAKGEGAGEVSLP